MTTSTYRAVQVSEPRKLELVQRAVTEPPPGKVRIQVEACGVCHSDAATVEGGVFPGLIYPRVFLVMRRSVRSMPSAKEFLIGKLASGLAWAFLAVIAASANFVEGEISSTASASRSPEYTTTVATPKS